MLMHEISYLIPILKMFSAGQPVYFIGTRQPTEFTDHFLLYTWHTKYTMGVYSFCLFCVSVHVCVCVCLLTIFMSAS